MINKSTPRVDYDQIAHLYDSQPYRQKEIDPHLLAFLSDHPDLPPHRLSILDMGCGTGAQLVANRQKISESRMVGLDLFHGMLRQAQPKAETLLWVRADNAHPPFADNAFDFITSQFSFHHVRDKSAMIRAVFRLLRPGGRFVMTNISPREMTGWLYYRYFPAAYELDLQDFLSKEVLVDLLAGAGFANVNLNLEHQTYEQDLNLLAQTARRRDTCSQLTAISDVDYRLGLRRLAAELDEAAGEDVSLQTEICLLTLWGEKY